MGETTLQNIHELVVRAKAHYQAGRFSDSTVLARRALEADPQCAEALHLMGLLAFRQGKVISAEDLFRIAISHNRSAANYYSNLAQLLSATGRIDEAIDFCRRSLAIRSDDSESHFILGKVLRTAGRVDEAIHAYERSIELRAEFAPAHVNLGMVQLLLGDFESGWTELEWRWERPELRKTREQLPGIRWDGSPLNGKRILLHTELGVSDALQFCRYAPLLARQGATVVLQCQPELVRLLRSVDGVTDVVASDIPPPPVELHCPLMSLPLMLRTNLSNIPADIPYLAPDSRDLASWKTRIASLGDPTGLKIGIAGYGSKDPPPGGSRPLPLDAIIHALGAGQRVTWFALQREDGAALSAIEPADRIVDWTADLMDFADTAALIGHLDLIVTHDSPIAHLAAAMRKPVWLLLPKVSDWRWMLNRTDSPWYPTIRIFRQRSTDTWDEPLQEITQLLREGNL